MGPNSDHIYHTDEVAAELGYHSQGGNALDQSLPSGKRLHNYGKSQFLMGKSTISMANLDSYVSLPEGNNNIKMSLLRRQQ